MYYGVDGEGNELSGDQIRAYLQRREAEDRLRYGRWDIFGGYVSDYVKHPRQMVV